jgi:hypothetical protein
MKGRPLRAGLHGVAALQAYFGAGVVVVVELVVELAGGVAGAVAELSAGAPVDAVEESAGGVLVVVVVVAAVSASGFLLQPPSARLEAASTAPVAISAERQDVDIIWVGSLKGGQA